MRGRNDNGLSDRETFDRGGIDIADIEEGDAYLKQGDLTAAITCYSRAQADLHCAQAYVQHEKYNEAVASYTRAIRPQCAYRLIALEERAKVYFMLGNYEFAIEDAKECLKTVEDKASLYSLVAQAQEKLGTAEELKNALENFIRAIQSVPMHKDVPKDFLNFLNRQADKHIFETTSRRNLFAAIKLLPNQKDVLKYLRKCIDPQTALGARMLISESATKSNRDQFTRDQICDYLWEHDPAYQYPKPSNSSFKISTQVPGTFFRKSLFLVRNTIANKEGEMMAATTDRMFPLDIK